MDRAGRWRTPVTLRGSVLEHELAVTGRRAAFAVHREVQAVALGDVARGRDGSYAVVWWGVDGPGLTEVDATGTVQVSTDLASERPLRFAKVAIDPGSGRVLVVWSQGTPSAGYRPVAWMK